MTNDKKTACYAAFEDCEDSDAAQACCHTEKERFLVLCEI
jgi:hypothetical protein